MFQRTSQNGIEARSQPGLGEQKGGGANFPGFAAHGTIIAQRQHENEPPWLWRGWTYAPVDQLYNGLWMGILEAR